MHRRRSRGRHYIPVALMLIAMAAYLFLWPVPVEPENWVADEPPRAEGPLAPNDLLAGVERFARGYGVGPEKMAFDAAGRLYAGVHDGRILRIDLAQRDLRPETFVQTGGRPLGLEFDPKGNLIVADPLAGLLSIGPDARITVLATDTSAEPKATFLDDVAVTPDGTIFCTDASWKFGYGKDIADILERRPNGRVLRWDTNTKKLVQVLDQLYFANGLALAPDASYLLINETSAYRVRRLWLKGDKQGRSDILTENLPGFPDNICGDGKGHFWIAIFAPRAAILDSLAAKPFLRKALYRLPSFVQPRPEHVARVIEIDSEGKIVRMLEDKGPDSYAPITTVRPHQGFLYFGSLSEDCLARLPLPKDK